MLKDFKNKEYKQTAKILLITNISKKMTKNWYLRSYKNRYTIILLLLSLQSVVVSAFQSNVIKSFFSYGGTIRV